MCAGRKKVLEGMMREHNDKKQMPSNLTTNIMFIVHYTDEVCCCLFPCEECGGDSTTNITTIS